MVSVVMQMTSLTHRLQILVAAILRRVIEMCCRDPHDRVRSIRDTVVKIRTTALMCVASAFTFAFTAPSRAVLDPARDVRPVLWVTIFVLGANWHQQKSFGKITFGGISRDLNSAAISSTGHPAIPQ